MNKCGLLLFLSLACFAACNYPALWLARQQLQDPANAISFTENDFYSIKFKSPVIRVADLSDLGIKPASTFRFEAGELRVYNVYLVGPNGNLGERPTLTVRVTAEGGCIAQIDLPRQFARIIPPELIMDYVGALCRQTIDYDRGRTVDDPSVSAALAAVSLPNQRAIKRVLGLPSATGKMDDFRTLDLYNYAILGQQVRGEAQLAVISSSAVGALFTAGFSIGNARIECSQTKASVWLVKRKFSFQPVAADSNQSPDKPAQLKPPK